MLQKNQRSEGTGPRAKRDDQRSFMPVLAGTTLLIAGLAVAAVLVGPALAPSQFSSSGSTLDTLALTDTGLGQTTPEALSQTRKVAKSSKAAPVGPDTSGKSYQLASLETGFAIKAPPAQASLEAAMRAEADTMLRAEEDKLREAEEAAKLALAAKLAKLKLTRTLLAAQAAKTRTPENAVEPGLAIASSAPVPSEDIGEETAPQPKAPVQVASLEPQAEEAMALNTAPLKPGAIPTRTPDAKPALPERSETAAAKRKKEKPAPASTVLAYATPGDPGEDDDDGVFSGLGKLFGGSRGGLPSARANKVAVYDISTATVHMPDGTKLEAHSGIGHRKDNPKFTHVRGLGPTPPNIYKLKMRERRFHGVEAIRMLPHDRTAMKGRDGMLAHTPLLRSSNGSHGCVAFTQYAKFLRAFKAGKVKTMIVVPSMNKLPTYMAALNRNAGV